MAVSEKQIGVRLPNWLHEELKRDAKANGWTKSQEVRFELMTLRGKWPDPALLSRQLPGSPGQELPHRRHK